MIKTASVCRLRESDPSLERSDTYANTPNVILLLLNHQGES